VTSRLQLSCCEPSGWDKAVSYFSVRFMKIKKTIITIHDAVRRSFRSDEILNGARGWTANLAIFRIIFLSLAVLPSALWMLDWTDRILPGLRSGRWVPISFYRLLPLGLLSNVPFARALALTNVLLVVLGLIGFCIRTAIGLATLLSLYLFGLPENQGMVTHYALFSDLSAKTQDPPFSTLVVRNGG
jgi:hypothetical protein